MRLGARGYRAAHLAAGVAAGRLALAAFALGHGASGITFFDNEVARFRWTRDSCLLATAVGVLAYRNRAGGRPRAPAELTRLRHPRLRCVASALDRCRHPRAPPVLPSVLA